MRAAVVLVGLAVCAAGSALPTTEQNTPNDGLQAPSLVPTNHAVGPVFGPDLRVFFVASRVTDKQFDPSSQIYAARFEAHINHRNNAMDIFYPVEGVTAKWESSNVAKSDGDLLEHCYTVAGGGQTQSPNPEDNVVICFRFRRWSVVFSSWWLKSTNVHDKNDILVEFVESDLYVDEVKLKQDYAPLV
ncbi:uncharacterized protein L969DRAFT_94708 [Mixia osmundae IAM 14324]|uniref:Uncharacterized protein n=1 Tax=Mixia osmundae (strain CBS 9802 / IAM 14324 / JCM 22182 / KY 12970) TaxID=764103 RepID=G7DVP9_MIXOS|nr:uncharacterized protein L969DRAFT_94708 [Mixia osmundae IAM 14324]KEI39659.1 hypothetical protein L969DRAFT_94708 [Mixia osmundae IAM 14324]GAA94659.1 hypothetical protein E5Q_01312 [Mixia osmundae IAM 14324]